MKPADWRVKMSCECVFIYIYIFYSSHILKTTRKENRKERLGLGIRWHCQRWNITSGTPLYKFACLYVLGSTLHTPPPHPTPCLHSFSRSLAVTAAHRGWAAHLGQVKWSCLVCSGLARPVWLRGVGLGVSHRFKIHCRYQPPPAPLPTQTRNHQQLYFYTREHSGHVKS